MNYIDFNQENFVLYLEAIRKRICAYYGPRCDCKYGILDKNSGEHSGCPECYLMKYFIESITSSEFKKIVDRIKRKQKQSSTSSSVKNKLKGNVKKSTKTSVSRKSD